ncbi:MAG: DUF302 domain-containing protein [Sulfurospirillum sp.]
MLYTITTQETIKNIKRDMADRAKKQGFGVLKEYHFKEILQEKGSPIQKDITVFEICNPSAAQTILDVHPEVSVFLPCRISLFEKDGKITMNTISIDNITENFELDPKIKIYMNSVFKKVKNIMNTWQS